MNINKKLPIGIQTFSEIIDDNYLYIDKTSHILNLVENYKYVFLNRPRRFGKSLLIDTIHNLFEGNKQLFKELYIYDKWDWKNKYPVIKISWDGNMQTIDDLQRVNLNIFKDNQQSLGIICEETMNMSVCLHELIKKAFEKYNKKVVILVDEYDKPILDTIDNLEQSKLNRNFIKGLYSVLKGCDKYIKFVMLTGVSKFSKVSIFSGLNNLKDIGLDKRYGDICGYTEQDLNTKFKPYLEDINMEDVKQWYNGYNFLGEKVYNPYDILLFIDNDKLFKNYWFETGTPTFLINLIKQNNYFLPNFENLEAPEDLLNSFDIDQLNLETIMFQSGYLTIKEVKNRRGKFSYILDFPNFEVKTSFYDYILKYTVEVSQKVPISNELYDALEDGNIQDLELVIKRLFASIAYNNFTNNHIENYEGFYASVLYAYFASLGIEMVAEDVTNQGRIDLTIKLDNKVFIFEFKVINEGPLKQIKEQKYHEKYIDKEKEIYIIGIVFDRKERNVSKFEWEKFPK